MTAARMSCVSPVPLLFKGVPPTGSRCPTAPPGRLAATSTASRSQARARELRIRPRPELGHFFECRLRQPRTCLVDGWAPCSPLPLHHYPPGSTFEGCRATGAGGALLVANVDFVLRDSAFRSCTSGGAGGALSLTSHSPLNGAARSRAVLEGLLFEGNTAERSADPLDPNGPPQSPAGSRTC